MRVPRLAGGGGRCVRAHRRCGRGCRGRRLAVPVAARPAAAGPAASSASALADVVVQPGRDPAGRPRQAGPPTTADCCERSTRSRATSPAQIQQAYDLPALYARGVTGKGATIVIVDSFGSPTIRNDLSVFDRDLRPARPAVVQDHPARGQGARLQPGQLRHGRLGRRDHAGRGVRAHDRAGREHPAGRDAGLGNRGRARLPADRRGREVRAQAPSRRRDQPELQRHRADLPERQSPSRRCAAPTSWPTADHVTVLAASGDSGAADVGLDQATYYLFPVTSWPDSDPLVTGVGGTQLHFNAAGQAHRADACGTTPTTRRRTSSPTATRARTRWPAAAASPSSSPGPSYQNGVQSVVGDQRGVPDISMSAACNGVGGHLQHLRRRAGLVPDLRHQRGHAAVRGHRRAGRPGGRAFPRPDQPGPVPAGGASAPRASSTSPRATTRCRSARAAASTRSPASPPAAAMTWPRALAR